MDSEKVLDTIEKFRTERSKIAGPIVERKIIPPPNYEADKPLQEEVKAEPKFQVKIKSSRQPVSSAEIDTKDPSQELKELSGSKKKS